MNSFDVRFRRKTIRPFRTYGRYRGSGKIEFFDNALRISGRHVMALSLRIVIGLCIFAVLFGALSIINFTIISLLPTPFMNDIMSNPILLSIYYILLSPISILLISSLVPNVIMEFIWLEKESLLIPYENVLRYVVNASKNHIGIEFAGNPNTTPVVLEHVQCSQIQALLIAKAPKSDVDVIVAPPEPVAHRVVSFIFVYLVSAALSFVVLFILLALFLTNENLPLTVEQMNTATLLLSIIVLVIVPLLIALKIDRKNFK